MTPTLLRRRLAAMTFITRFLPHRVSGRSDIFVRDHVLAFVMSIFIRFGEGFVFILYALYNPTKFLL
jgi:hypothetical protein